MSFFWRFETTAEQRHQASQLNDRPTGRHRWTLSIDERTLSLSRRTLLRKVRRNSASSSLRVKRTHDGCMIESDAEAHCKSRTRATSRILQVARRRREGRASPSPCHQRRLPLDTLAEHERVYSAMKNEPASRMRDSTESQS